MRASGMGFGNEPGPVGWRHAGAVAARCHARAAAGSGATSGPETRTADGGRRRAPMSPMSVWVSGNQTPKRTCRLSRAQRARSSDGWEQRRSRPGRPHNRVAGRVRGLRRVVGSDTEN